MVKATLRSAVLLGLLVWSTPGFAEVQNVKVGGDITVRSFFRSNLDLNDNTARLAAYLMYILSSIFAQSLASSPPTPGKIEICA